MEYDKGLIYDVGMHHGVDTEFYLNKGFRVVAIEANPDLVEKGMAKFETAIRDGRLIIVEEGISEADGIFEFYANADKDDWSSFNKSWGTRDGTKYEVMKIKCTTLDKILARYGIPYYLKIDIEGFDLLCVKALHQVQPLPPLISAEIDSLELLSHLAVLGYKQFKLVNQACNYMVKCPKPAKEGNYYDAAFTPISSGPFGEEAPGDWRDLDSVAAEFLHIKRDLSQRPEFHYFWWDIHARL